MLKQMSKQIRAARENESGFTLIELLIVIVILGVLAAIVVFAVGAFNKDGKAAACKSDVKNVEIAEEAAYAKTNPHAYEPIAQLVTDGYLKEAPGTANYTITVDTTTGAVTSSPANCAF